MIEIVSVCCRRDLALLTMQASSITRYFDPSGLKRVLYIWNETEEFPSTTYDDLDRAFNGVEYQLLPADALGVDHNDIVTDGWTTQQALKLLAGRLVTTNSYLVLDSKNHFLRASTTGDFIDTDQRGIFPFVDLCRQASYRFCLDYFGAEPDPDNCRGVLNVTPFLLRTSVVEHLLTMLERIDGRSTIETFFTHQHKLSEFLAYQAYFVSEGGKLSDLFREVHTQRDVVLWSPTVLNRKQFDECMDLLEFGSPKVMALHWIAACLLTADQRARLCTLWMNRELVTSIEEGQLIINSIVANLSNADKNYLERHLHSKRIKRPGTTTSRD